MSALRRLLGGFFLFLYRLRERARGKLFSLLGGGAFAAFGARSVLQPPVRLKGEGRIAIGDDVYVGAGSWLHVVSGNGRGVAISIGDGTSIAGACVLSAARSISVGKKVLMARNVYVSDHSHAFESIGPPVVDQGIARVAPVEIGDGAWLGQNVFVGPGVCIGAGAVIGANAVVLHNVPAHSVAVGVPAAVTRSLLGEAAPLAG